MSSTARIFSRSRVAFVALLAAAGLVTACTPPVATQLTRYPYLTDLVGNSVMVNFATDTSNVVASTSWGAVDSGGSCTPTNVVAAARTAITVGTTSEYQWQSTLTLPGPGTYCYRVYLGSVDLLGGDGSPEFTTQVPAGAPDAYSFAVFGDWGQTNSAGDNPDTTRLMGQIASSGARFAVTVGDNGYPAGSQTNNGDLKQHAADTSAIFGQGFWALVGKSLPLFATPGNHGFSSGTATRSTEMVNWPQDQAVATSGGRYVRETYCCVNGTLSASYPSAWYAFDAGNARFYVLSADWADANVGTGTVYSDDYAAHWDASAPEYQWLQADLAAHPSGLKFAFFHYPMYSDQKAQNSDTFLRGTNSLEGLLSSYHVAIGFSGHAHLYERNAPTGPGTFPTYITGGGGGTLQPVGELGCSAFDAYAIGWSPTHSSGSSCGSASPPPSADHVYHYLLVTVSGTTVTVAPTDEYGRTFDVVTYDLSANVPPDTYFDSTPAAVSTATNAEFTFHASAPSSTFECQLDGSGFAPCTSPADFTGLAEGTHTFQVRAVDVAGPDPAPASFTFSVDLTAPTVPGNVTATADVPTVAHVAWDAASDATGVTSYQVSRDGTLVGTVSGGTTTFDDSTVAPATTYQYTVVAVDGAGNASAPSDPASVTTPSPTTHLFSDGFESGDLAQWTSSAGLTVQSTTVQAGTFAALASTTNGNTFAKVTLPSTYTDAYARAWVDLVSTSSQVNLLRMRAADDTSIGYVYVTASGNLGFRNDVTATNTTSTTHLPAGSGWHALELHLLVNDTSSTVQVWLDGVPVPDLTTTTATLGTAPVGRLQIGDVQSGRTYTVAYDQVAFDVTRIGP
jgi:hypothetical protein